MAAPTPHRVKTKTVTQKVRVIAKVRGSTDAEAEPPGAAPWINVHKPEGDASDCVTISFGEEPASRRESYQVNFCYEQNQGNDVIFLREVKPLISGVFDGCDATFVASGARGSGKSYLIQGTEEELGLAALAMADLLSIADGNGKSIAISCYEIFQDHVRDLLYPNRQEVLVLGDGRGKILLKGLSRVSVTSMSEFQTLYGIGCISRKAGQKISNELPRRSHRGLIIYVSPQNENSNTVILGKINFVDLAGYEDARRKSIDGVGLIENNKINNTIYAIHNVVCSLNANENHVPYRESKLTHMLQDSLGGTGRVLMITCLHPYFCQDSVNMMSLASRSYQRAHRMVTESTKKINGLTRSVIHSSLKNRIVGSQISSVKKQSQLSKKETKSTASSLKARKLFDEASNVKCENVSLQTNCLDNASRTESSKQGEEKQASDVNHEIFSVQEASSLTVFDSSETTDKDVLHNECNHEAIPISELKSATEEGQKLEKENNNCIINRHESPPISARLQEISNNLKLLYSSTPTYVAAEPKADTEFMEPRTPEPSITVNNVQKIPKFCSPWENFSARGTGAKNSLVQEYLNFLNTASKEELKKLKGIGEKRATYILELREESEEPPFKDLDDLKDIGLSAKQIKNLVKKEVGGLFN